ncbi:MAG: hypothetical protein ACJ8C4_15745 [Gemmataceae bacterium]
MARTRSQFDAPAVSRPSSDAYTGLLALSLLAMIASCVILYLDYAQYGTQKAPAVNVPQPAPKTPAIQQGNVSNVPNSEIIPVVAIEVAPPVPVPVAAPSLLPAAADGPALPNN